MIVDGRLSALQRLRPGLGHSGRREKKGKVNPRGQAMGKSAAKSPTFRVSVLGHNRRRHLSILSSGCESRAPTSWSPAHRLFFILCGLDTPHLPSPPLPASIGGAALDPDVVGKTQSVLLRSFEKVVRTCRLGVLATRRAPSSTLPFRRSRSRWAFSASRNSQVHRENALRHRCLFLPTPSAS